jgi:hypothetical protein
MIMKLVKVHLNACLMAIALVLATDVFSVANDVLRWSEIRINSPNRMRKDNENLPRDGIK